VAAIERDGDLHGCQNPEPTRSGQEPAPSCGTQCVVWKETGFLQRTGEVRRDAQRETLVLEQRERQGFCREVLAHQTIDR
jgi:hypothetical protein